MAFGLPTKNNTLTNRMHSLKEPEIRRLILAKKLYVHGLTLAAQKDEISRMLAVLHFDNVVETILKCLATKYQIASSVKSDPRFKDLWVEIAKNGGQLILKDQLFWLHDLRNFIQHQGSIPSAEDVIRCKTYTEDFFREICPKEIGVPYDKLYLSSLIKNEKLKEKILNAETVFEKRDFKQCAEACEAALLSAFFDQSDVFEAAGELTGYLGASEELKKVVGKNYSEEFKGKDFHVLAKDLSRALAQLGQGVASMQFLDEYRTDFLKHRKTFENLNNLSDKELEDFAQSSLIFVTNLILKWEEHGILK